MIGLLLCPAEAEMWRVSTLRGRPSPLQESKALLSTGPNLAPYLGYFLPPAKSLTSSGLMENPLVGKKLKSQHPSKMHQVIPSVLVDVQTKYQSEWGKLEKLQRSSRNSSGQTTLLRTWVVCV